MCLDCLVGGIGPTRLRHKGTKTIVYPRGLTTTVASPRYSSFDSEEGPYCMDGSGTESYSFYPSYQDEDDEPKM